jgi:hypothetical protein
VNARIAHSELAASPSSCLTGFIAISRSSRGHWGTAVLTELSPQLFQPVEESLPSRFNRMVAHACAFAYAYCARRAPLGQCAPFSRKPPNLPMSASALAPMILRKAGEAFPIGVEWPQLGALRLARPRRRATPARFPPKSVSVKGDRKRARGVAYVRADDA